MKNCEHCVWDLRAGSFAFPDGDGFADAVSVGKRPGQPAAPNCTCMGLKVWGVQRADVKETVYVPRWTITRVVLSRTQFYAQFTNSEHWEGREPVHTQVRSYLRVLQTENWP
jgi:hypothetical protein